MELGIIKMTRNEYRKGDLCVVDHKISLLGIPIYRAKVTSTNNEALRRLTTLTQNKMGLIGFKVEQLNENYEAKDINKKN